MKIYLSRDGKVVHSIVRILATGLFLCYIIVLLFGIEIDYSILSVVVIVTTVVEIADLLLNRTVYNSGLLMVFFAYTALVHNGFVIAYFFDKSYASFQSLASMSFLNISTYPKAILIANAVILAFVLSAEVSRTPFEYLNTRSIESKDFKGDKAADIIGISVLGFGTFFLAYLIVRYRLWFAGYTSVMSVTGNIPLYSHSVILTSLSIAMLMSAGTKRGVKRGLLIYLLTMMLHFAIGNRGEVLYSAVVCFALYSIRFKTIKIKHVVLTLVLMVILIPLVRITRELKLDAYTLNPISSLLDVLCEEGLEISPFTHLVNYIKNGHGHVFGMTYVNDFTDFIARRVGLSSPFYIEPYVIRSIMPHKGMGFTMIAELYYNFNVFGACIIYAFFAQIMKHLDRVIYLNEISSRNRVFAAMFMVEMINLSRNDASTLPVYMAYCLILLIVYRQFSKAKARGSL